MGAVLADEHHRILSVGYNGFPRGVEDSDERYNHRPTKYTLIVHAEANAITNALLQPANAHLFCTVHPCHECAKLIIQSGIRNVYCAPPPEDAKTPGRWAEHVQFAYDMFKEAGIKVHLID